MSLLEITDLVIAHDPVSRGRLPVRRDAVVARLEAAGDRRGARIAAGLPCDAAGVLDPGAVDRRLVAIHTELQRLSEEIRHGERVAALLRPLLTALRAADPAAPLRVVDIGTGLGYLPRWLAAANALTGATDGSAPTPGRPGAAPVGGAGPVPGPAAVPADAAGSPPHPATGPAVELIGVDYHAALVAEADRLAQAEGLACRFVQGDAFALDEPATVYISSGVLHHFRGPDLDAFFRAQSADRSGAAAFCHFDIAATGLAPVGAWIFHRARMRDPLGRHDGVVSARRAHDDRTLLRAAAHAKGLVPLVYEPRTRSNPFCTTLRPVLGIRPDLLPAVRAALGDGPSGRLLGTAEATG
ncbi:methyltransferase domain-containing protein [Streptomyces sp. NPDC101490]|uniref:class I SAM-dependent methyltransferase n=1 Tax=Streptomyces sp. NPDC101490 TaxID=3366143 RepID=UPI003829FD06